MMMNDFVIKKEVVVDNGNVSDGTTEVSMVNVTDIVNEDDDDSDSIFPYTTNETATRCTTTYTKVSDVTMKKSCCFEKSSLFGMKGLQKDWEYQKLTYVTEWTRRPQSISKVISATIFSFFTQLIPALIFAELLDTMTHGHISAVETVLSAGIIGVIYSVITGQSLVLLGITGPVALLLGTSYSLAEETFHTEYWSFFFWICLWTSILHILTAMNDTVMNFVKFITPFTSSIFEFFIGITFIYEALRELILPLHLLERNAFSTTSTELLTGEQEGGDEMSPVWVSFVFGVCAFIICYTLHFAEANWNFFTYPVRAFLSSYNMVLSTVIVTSLSYLPGIPNTTNEGVERVHVMTPWDWQPSDPNRTWIVNPFAADISWKGVLGAFFPAFMLHLLFFVDHNISSMLTQDPKKYNLKKKPTYHWDFFCLGITIIPCAILGLPPGCGLIPQAPLHTNALATTQTTYKEDGTIKEVTTYVEEQRYSALGQSMLMFVTLVSFRVVAMIPKSALFGIFLYLGVCALYNNEIWHRFLYILMVEENRPMTPLLINVGWSTVRIYTIMQIVCALIIFGVAQFTFIGYVFPALVTALVPFRFYVLPRCFQQNDLEYLDPF